MHANSPHMMCEMTIELPLGTDRSNGSVGLSQTPSLPIDSPNVVLSSKEQQFFLQKFVAINDHYISEYAKQRVKDPLPIKYSKYTQRAHHTKAGRLK